MADRVVKPAVESKYGIIIMSSYWSIAICLLASQACPGSLVLLSREHIVPNDVVQFIAAVVKYCQY